MAERRMSAVLYILNSATSCKLYITGVKLRSKSDVCIVSDNFCVVSDLKDAEK